MLSLTPKAEAIPRMSIYGTFDLGAFLTWAGDFRGAAKFSKLDSAVVFIGGAQREEASEVVLRQVLDSAQQLIDWTRPGKVFVITETVSADTIDISLSRSARAVLTDTISADSAKSLGIGFTWTPTSMTQLSLRFPQPYRVFYKADQIIRRTGSLENDTLPKVLHIPASDIAWRETAP